LLTEYQTLLYPVIEKRLKCGATYRGTAKLLGVVGEFPGWHERCSLTRQLKKGDFDHAVDNLGDPFGLVADWLALKRWWQSYPPTARGGRSGFGHQPDYW
jgi:hypothetical protein